MSCNFTLEVKESLARPRHARPYFCLAAFGRRRFECLPLSVHFNLLKMTDLCDPIA